MPGPNSVPTGDTRLMMGHVNTEYVCFTHKDKHLDVCESKKGCEIVSLREYLSARGALRTGKTK